MQKILQPLRILIPLAMEIACGEPVGLEHATKILHTREPVSYTHLMLLKGKTIIVSGVGPGMGRALARLAAEAGANIVLGARNQAFLEEVAADITQAGGQALALSTDVSQSAQCQALAAAAVARFGRIDGLINSAYFHGNWATTDLSLIHI